MVKDIPNDIKTPNKKSLKYFPPNPKGDTRKGIIIRQNINTTVQNVPGSPSQAGSRPGRHQAHQTPQSLWPNQAVWVQIPPAPSTELYYFFF